VVAERESNGRASIDPREEEGLWRGREESLSEEGMDQGW